MHRLTTRNQHGGIVADLAGGHSDVVINRIILKLAAYEDTGLEPKAVAVLAAAKQTGRLAILPIAPGTPVYTIDQGRVRYKSAGLVTTNLKNYTRYETGTTTGFSADQIGKIVFLTQEEAEAALAAPGDAP